MPIVNMHEAKTQLSRLVDSLTSGTEAEITIARDGVPAAKLVAVDSPRKKVRLGLARDRFPDFDMDAFNALDEEVAQLFNGSDA